MNNEPKTSQKRLKRAKKRSDFGRFSYIDFNFNSVAENSRFLSCDPWDAQP